MSKMLFSISLVVSLIGCPVFSAESMSLYIINLSNNAQLFAKEITFNERFESLSFRSLKTGLNSTLPLNRILTIEMATKPKGEEVVAESILTQKVFENDQSLLHRLDDGGIPCNFVVISESVSSSARNAASSSGGSSSSFGSGLNSRGSSSSSSKQSTSGYGTSGFNSSGFSTSRNQRSSNSSWSSSSNSGADAFMDIFFR